VVSFEKYFFCTPPPARRRQMSLYEKTAGTMTSAFDDEKA
jgi:hypothetical protein